jgi:hypothetical protein
MDTPSNTPSGTSSETPSQTPSTPPTFTELQTLNTTTILGGIDSAAAQTSSISSFETSSAGIGTFAGIGAGSILTVIIVAALIKAKAKQAAAKAALSSTNRILLNKNNPLHVQRLPSPQLNPTTPISIAEKGTAGQHYSSIAIPGAAVVKAAPILAQYGHFRSQITSVNNVQLSSVANTQQSIAARSNFQSPRDKISFAPKTAASTRTLV